MRTDMKTFNQLVDEGYLVPYESQPDSYKLTDPDNTMIVHKGNSVDNFWVYGSSVTCEVNENEDGITIPLDIPQFDLYKKVE